MFFNLLPIIAERSTCLRGQTAAIIVKDGRIVSIGYNGAPPNMPHCHPNRGCSDNDGRGCQQSVHAEANAIAFAARAGISTEGAEMYCMSSPCYDCAKLIVACGIKKVHYSREYRAEAGRHWFEACHVELVAHV
jgi:dCMP deaminase